MPTPSAREIRIEFDQRVPMRDGIMLSADVYRPIDKSGETKTYPVILTRTPYMKLSEGILVPAKYFTERGYVFVAMDVRGRGDSDGVFVPYFNEGEDGYDAIEWCAAQPWSDGNVGTIGSSYPGNIQWLAALQKPPRWPSAGCTMSVGVSTS